MSIAEVEGSELREVSLSDLMRHPHQPRFDETEDLDALKESIESEGLIVPPTVVPHPKQGGKFFIVAGHRRVRAMRDLGWSVTKVLVVPFSHNDVLAPLVENVVKKDLSAIEWARSLAAAYEMGGEEITKTELGRRIGKDRNFVAKAIRIGNLPKKILENIYKLGSGKAGPGSPYQFANNIKVLDKVAACYENRDADSAARLVEKLRLKEDADGFNRDIFLRMAKLEAEAFVPAPSDPPPNLENFAEPVDRVEIGADLPELSGIDYEEAEMPGPSPDSKSLPVATNVEISEKREEKVRHKQDAGYLIEEFSDGKVRIQFDPKRLTAATASDLAFALRKYAAGIS